MNIIDDAGQKWLDQRLNLTSSNDSKQIASQMPVNIRMHCFFSAKVATQRVANELKSVATEYYDGKLTQAQARVKLKSFLSAEGYEVEHAGKMPEGVDPAQWTAAKKLSNLGSTARLNLILQQNADMADAIGTYQMGRDPDVEKEYPFWRYRSLDDARESHKHFDGKVFRKDDPIWNTIFPPRDFRCRCWVEDVSEKELPEGKVSKISQAEKDLAHTPNESGFKFNPRDAFASWSQKELEATGMTFDPAELARLKLSVDKLKGLTLRPFGEDGRNKYTTAKALGLVNTKDWTPVTAPPLSNLQETLSSIKEGESILAKDNSKVIFNNNLLNHFLDKKDREYRIMKLETAKQTIKNPVEIWDQEGQRTYIQKFKNDDKEFFMIVSVNNNGEVNSFFEMSEHEVNKRRKGLSVKTMTNKKEEPNE